MTFQRSEFPVRKLAADDAGVRRAIFRTVASPANTWICSIASAANVIAEPPNSGLEIETPSSE